MGAWWFGPAMLLAALLEAGGDALVRVGVRGGGAGDAIGAGIGSGVGGGARLVAVAGGGMVLLGYGVLVNVVPGGFNRVLGIYAAVFLLVAQGIGWLLFGERPGTGMLVGGALVVAGGVVMTAWR